MYTVIVSTVSSGRVIRKRFSTLVEAESYAHHAEVVRTGFSSGLRGVRIEIEATTTPRSS